MTVKLRALLLLVVVVIGVQSDRHIVSVTTNIGVINGFTENVTFLDTTAELNKFLGIPFAEPPLGDLRFKKPVPKSPLLEPLDAFAHGNACVQGYNFLNVTHSEDCLYLNIYSPVREDLDVKLPVMIWIYGGGFHFGESNSYNGDHLSIVGNVIVVTLNYRLSIFGFLSTGDEASPGNYGLWDQHLAIKWVHDNIASFGGDTEKVTIFGESAGSCSVIYQGLYRPPGNDRLFQRMIAQSGSIMGWWGNTDKGPHVAKEVAAAFDCSLTSSHAIVSCLRQIPADQLITLATYPPEDVGIPAYAFLPTRDDDFVKYDSKDVFHSQHRHSIDAIQYFASLDLLTGVNAGEGVTGLDPMFGVPESDMMTFLPNRTDFENRLVPIFIKEVFGEDFVSVLKKIILSEYTNWMDPDNSYNVRDEFLRMHADATYNAPMYITLDGHSSAASTSKSYMYYLDYKPDTPIYVIPWYDNAIHAADVPLVFGYDVSLMFGTQPAAWELRLSESVMNLWTNFARTGNPNSPVDLGLNWEPYTFESHHYLQITRNMTSSNVKQRWNIGSPYFWSDVVPSITQLKACDQMIYGTSNSATSVFLSGIVYTRVYMFALVLAIAAIGLLY